MKIYDLIQEVKEMEISHLTEAVKGNTQPNEKGEYIYTFEEEVRPFVLWRTIDGGSDSEVRYVMVDNNEDLRIFIGDDDYEYVVDLYNIVVGDIEFIAETILETEHN